MDNVKNLIDKILQEGKNKETEILSLAEKERETILQGKSREAEIEKELILTKAKEEAQSKKERIISNTTLKIRNEKLQTKQRVMDEVFKEALEKLCNMNVSNLKNYIKHAILDLDIVGDEVIILNEDGKSKITEEFISEINSILVARHKKGELSIREEKGNFKGGFILEKNGIEINNTFEALVYSMKDELEYEVSKTLFD